MIAATDVHYRGDHAHAVCVLFERWTDDAPIATRTHDSHPVAEYESGAFYKRELPCLLGLLDADLRDALSCVVIDGFVVLDDRGRPGLGAYLYDALERRIPVVGVAKTGFRDNRLLVREVRRGGSQRPLFVTSAGMDVDSAARHVQVMHGPHRIPSLLKRLDRLTRRQPG